MHNGQFTESQNQPESTYSSTNISRDGQFTCGGHYTSEILFLNRYYWWITWSCNGDEYTDRLWTSIFRVRLSDNTKHKESRYHSGGTSYWRTTKSKINFLTYLLIFRRTMNISISALWTLFQYPCERLWIKCPRKTMPEKPRAETVKHTPGMPSNKLPNTRRQKISWGKKKDTLYITMDYSKIEIYTRFLL